MAVSPKLTSFRIREPLAVRVRLESLSSSVEREGKALQHGHSGGNNHRGGGVILAAAPVHPPDRGIPFLDQLTAGEGVPSAWQSSLTVSPGAYSWLTGEAVQ